MAMYLTIHICIYHYLLMPSDLVTPIFQAAASQPTKNLTKFVLESSRQAALKREQEHLAHVYRGQKVTRQQQGYAKLNLGGLCM